MGDEAAKNRSMSASSDDQQARKRDYFTPDIAAKYVTAAFHSAAHQQWVSSMIFNALELQPGHTLVDMGCGPGLELVALIEKMKSEIRAIGVDPSEGMLDASNQAAGANAIFDRVCMDAATFSQSTQYAPYDRMFMKGVVHLLSSAERAIAFPGFYKQLAPNCGKLVIVRGSYGDDVFPFNERTKDFFRKANGPEALQTLLDELSRAGFTKIETDVVVFRYPAGSVKAEDWIYLLENRTWSTFSQENINDEQMVDLIAHVKKQFESPEGFQSIDRQTIITCWAQ